ncbi:MAG: protein N-lysine methyltransferase family protein [Desulfotalea sp.]
MDIRQLPSKERDIYNRLRKDNKLTFDKLSIKDKTLRLLTIADLKEYLGSDPKLQSFLDGDIADPKSFLEKLQSTDVSDFPFWIRLWDAAIILSYLLSSLPDSKGKTVLELGAGLGAPGLAAASVGMDVTISDYEEMIVDFQRVSAAASNLPGVKFCLLDWLNPPELPRFDILTAAEVLFREEFFQPLLNVFKKYLKPDGVVWLAHDARRKSLPAFLELAKEDFDIAINKQEFQRDGKGVMIIVNRLKLKS